MRYLLIALVPVLAHADGIVERRIWIEKAYKDLQEKQCTPEVKSWSCLFPDRLKCDAALKEMFDASCSASLVPDLPEYIDGPETKAKAQKVIMDCLTTELAKRYIIPLPHEKMEEYNVCTGAVARTKPLNPYLQKALDFSKTQTTTTCAAGGFMRKCFSLPDPTCKELLNKEQLGCTMKKETEGDLPKDDAGAQETGRKITDCALQAMRKGLDSSRKRIKDKDCE